MSTWANPWINKALTMFSALLALTLAQGITTAPDPLDRLRLALTPAVHNTHEVVLDCRVTDKALTDCRSTGKPLDEKMMEQALRLTAGIVVPQAMADAGDGHVRVKMNLAP
jgi:hypothetical protein